jgi:hypothetical protein
VLDLQTGLHPPLLLAPRRVVTVVVAPSVFQSPPRSHRRSGSAISPSPVSSALRSSRHYAGLFATTASADSSRALAREASPGKVHELSARAVRLYPMRLSVTLGFRVLQHAHRPHRGLSAGSSSYGRAFATAFFQLTFLTEAALAFTTVAVTASEHFPSYV